MELFETQKAVLREAVEKGPAVVVGRAGFAVLRREPGLLSVFLHAPLEVRAERIQKIYKLGSLAEAKEMVVQSDRQRERFIRAASGLDWREPQNYHLCVDTARLGTAETIELIYGAAMEVARELMGSKEEQF